MSVIVEKLDWVTREKKKDKEHWLW